MRDVFSRWDEDGSGAISRAEWSQVLKSLLGGPAADAGLLFDYFDADSSGELDYNELHSRLRQGTTIELDAVLLGARVHETTATNRAALRTDGPQSQFSRVLGSVTLHMAEGDGIAEQIRNALVGSWTRTADI